MKDAQCLGIFPVINWFPVGCLPLFNLHPLTTMKLLVFPSKSTILADFFSLRNDLELNTFFEILQLGCYVSQTI